MLGARPLPWSVWLLTLDGDGILGSAPQASCSSSQKEPDVPAASKKPPLNHWAWGVPAGTFRGFSQQGKPPSCSLAVGRDMQASAETSACALHVFSCYFFFFTLWTSIKCWSQPSRSPGQ